MSPPLQVDLWPFDLESGVWITCAVGYFCANFSLPRPLCSRLRPDVRDGQTDVRQTSDAHHRLMPPPYGGGGIISSVETRETTLQHCRQPERHPLNAVWLLTLFSFEQFSLSAYAHCTCARSSSNNHAVRTCYSWPSSVVCITVLVQFSLGGQRGYLVFSGNLPLFNVDLWYIFTILLCLCPHRAEALSDAFVWRLSDVWRLSRTSGLTREQRGLGRLAQR